MIYYEDEGINIFGSSSVFSPNNLNTLAWYDVDDDDTITESSGSTSQVDDKSGNGLHLVQGTANLQPQIQTAQKNGRNTLLFDGSDDTMKSTTTITENAQINTIYIAARIVSKSGTDNLFDGFGASDRQSLFINTSRFALFAGSSLVSSTLVINDGDYYIIKSTFNGASSEIEIDETVDVTGNAGADGMAGVTIGSRQDGAQNCHMELCEFVWIDGEVTGDDDTNMWNYLNNKWAVY